MALDGSPALPGITTLYEMFTKSVERFPDNDCLGRRSGEGPYTFMTYKQVGEATAAVGSAMAYCGLEAHGRAGVYGVNSPEWMIAMQASGRVGVCVLSVRALHSPTHPLTHPCQLQACNRMNVYCVPLYDTLGDNAVEYIVKHSESTIVFAQAEKLGMLVKALPRCTDLIKTVVYWGTTDDATTKVHLAWGPVG
jgi:long-chain acyl-CoA synthetase